MELLQQGKEDLDKLFVLSREGVNKDIIDIFHEKSRHVNKYVIADILASEAVVPVVWRVLNRMSPGMKVDIHKIEEIIKEEIIGIDILHSTKMKLVTGKVLGALKK